MDAQDRSIVAFDTPLGVCAVRWTEAGIASVRLPSAGTATLPRITDSADVPGHVKAAIGGVAAVMGGERVDLGYDGLDEHRIDPVRRAVYAAPHAIPPGSNAT